MRLQRNEIALFTHEQKHESQLDESLFERHNCNLSIVCLFAIV